MEPQVNEVTVNGVSYIQKGSQHAPEIVGDFKIVILQRGWVMVGRLERNGSECKLHNSSVIRIWGTTKGLGEIAVNGPTLKTVLDKNCGIVEFDYLTVVATLSVSESKWKNAL